MMGKTKYIAAISAALIAGVILGSAGIAGAGSYWLKPTSVPAVPYAATAQPASVAATLTVPAPAPAAAGPVVAPAMTPKAVVPVASVAPTSTPSRVCRPTPTGSAPSYRTTCRQYSPASPSGGSGSTSGWTGGGSRGGYGGCGW